MEAIYSGKYFLIEDTDKNDIFFAGNTLEGSLNVYAGGTFTFEYIMSGEKHTLSAAYNSIEKKEGWIDVSAEVNGESVTYTFSDKSGLLESGDHND